MNQQDQHRMTEPCGTVETQFSNEERLEFHINQEKFEDYWTPQINQLQ